MARLHLISLDAGQVLTEFKPTTDAITMELTAWFAAPAAIIAIFKMFSFFTCQTGEAEERVKAVTLAVAESHAMRAAEVANQNEAPEPRNAFWSIPDEEAEEIEADHAAALGIEGDEQPAFVENPATTAEAVAAGFIKADKERKPRRARKRTKAHRSSVVQWAKERTFPTPGRHLWSDAARPDYEQWCEDLNLEPVPPTTFGLVMRDEVLPSRDAKERKGNRTKYFDIGLRAAGLRVVSGGIA